MTWTHFYDMHSGGGTKEPPYEHIFIEAPEAEARVIFYNRFGHNPDRVTCTCCGPDYSTTEGEDLAQLTAFHRGCDSGYLLPDGTELSSKDLRDLPVSQRAELDACFQYFERPGGMRSFKYMTLEEYKAQGDVLIIPSSEILPEERHGHVPDQGYVWV